MPIFRKQSAIPRFDRQPYHSSFSAGIRYAVHRKFNQRTSLRQHAIVPLCKQGRTAARFQRIGTAVYLIANAWNRLPEANKRHDPRYHAAGMRPQHRRLHRENYEPEQLREFLFRGDPDSGR